jgi:hypothetical protein
MRRSTEKQIELNKIKAISLATIDYLVENPEPSFSGDDDTLKDLYQHFRIQIDRYFQKRRLDRLQHRLSHFFDILIGRADLNFTKYIREKTGFEIKLLEGLLNRVNIILERNEIKNQKEANDISLLSAYYQKTSSNKDDIEKFNALLVDYYKIMVPVFLKKQKGYTKNIVAEEKDGLEIISITMHSGPQSK